MQRLTLYIVIISALAVIYTAAAPLAQAESNANPEARAVYNAPSTAKPDAAASEKKFFSGLTDTYRLGLALVGISALLVIVWGGLTYIWAGENTSQVQEGRKRIRNALVGILIAAISYALLYTINPDLVKFQIRSSSTNSSQTK